MNLTILSQIAKLSSMKFSSSRVHEYLFIDKQSYLDEIACTASLHPYHCTVLFCQECQSHVVLVLPQAVQIYHLVTAVPPLGIWTPVKMYHNEI